MTISDSFAVLIREEELYIVASSISSIAFTPVARATERIFNPSFKAWMLLSLALLHFSSNFNRSNSRTVSMGKGLNPTTNSLKFSAK